jgi:hypothetical protein
MNKIALLSSVMYGRLKAKLFPVKPEKKVGIHGFWQAGEVMDYGEFFVAHASHNGVENVLSVRGFTREQAIKRRDFLVAAAMRDSRADKGPGYNAVQLIARTEGDKTIEIK